MSRKNLVVKIDVPRDVFYNKELSFQGSCSYGPGQYDSLYEEKAINYPLAYVRWTEKKNFEALLDMMFCDRINMKSLITHRFPFDNVLEAYDILLKGNSLGIVLQYKPSDLEKKWGDYFKWKTAITCFVSYHRLYRSWLICKTNTSTDIKLCRCSFKDNCKFNWVTREPCGEKFGFENSTFSYSSVLGDKQTDTIFITTRHIVYASLVA